MKYIECDVMGHDESVSIPVEVFEAYAKQSGLVFYAEHRPLVVFTPEGLAFSGLYEVPNGTYKVEFFRQEKYSQIDPGSKVYELYEQDSEKVSFEEVREAISTWVPIVDKLLLSGFMSLDGDKTTEN